MLDVSPCDDGTLLAAFVEGGWKYFTSSNELKLFMMTPRIDRQRRTLAFEAGDFVRIAGEGFRVWKQPLFCWSLLETVLTTIVSRAVQLSGLDGGRIFEYDEGAEEFTPRAQTDLIGTLAESAAPVRKGKGVVGRTALTL